MDELTRGFFMMNEWINLEGLYNEWMNKLGVSLNCMNV